MRRTTSALLLLLAAPASAQMVHHGVGRLGTVTEVVSYVDAWEEGTSGATRDGVRDVLTRVERRLADSTTSSAHLLLFGPWGLHGYAFDEAAIATTRPVATGLRTSWQALDVDADGTKELLFVERRAETQLAEGDDGLETVSLLTDHRVGVRYLAREGGALVEHALEMDPQDARVKLLLAAELPGAQDTLLQLAAADAEFSRQRFEQAAYRYRLVREWAEGQLPAQEVSRLGLDVLVPVPDPDLPEVLWIAATRRLGSLPRWYQTHGR